MGLRRALAAARQLQNNRDSSRGSSGTTHAGDESSMCGSQTSHQQCHPQTPEDPWVFRERNENYPCLGPELTLPSLESVYFPSQEVS